MIRSKKGRERERKKNEMEAWGLETRKRRGGKLQSLYERTQKGIRLERKKERNRKGEEGINSGILFFKRQGKGWGRRDSHVRGGGG